MVIKPTVRDSSGNDVTSQRTKQTPSRSSSSSSSSSTSTKSGDTKLAAYRASHSSEPSSPTITSGSEEDLQAKRLITSDIGRSAGVDRTRDALQNLNESSKFSNIFSTITPTVPTPLISNFNVPEADLPEGIEVLTGQTDWQQNSSSWDRTKLKIKDKLKPVTDGYDSLQSSVSDMIPTLSENKQRDAEIMAELMSNSPEYAAAVEKIKTEHPEQLEQTTFGEIYEGAYEHVQEKPIGTAIEIGALYAGGAAIGLAGRLGSMGARSGLLKAGAKVAEGAAEGSKLKVAGQAISSSEKFVDPALAVVGSVPIAMELAEASPLSLQPVGVPPESEGMGRGPGMNTAGTAVSIEYDSDKVEDFVDTTFDLAVMGAGAVKGWKAGTDFIGRIQTRGRTEIPLDSITDADVASGMQDFPLTRRGQTPDELVAEFKRSEYGLPGEEPGPHLWHGSRFNFEATTKSRYEIPRGLESSDMPGLYGSPRFSPEFTRVPRTKLSDQYSLFGASEPLSPKAYRIKVNDVGRMPEGARDSISGGREFLWGKQANKGDAYLTPNAERASVTGRVEAEATLTPGSNISKVGDKYFTKIGNRRVPIDQYLAEIGIKPKDVAPGKKSTTVKDFLESAEYYNPNAKSGLLKSENIFSLASESSPFSQINPLSEIGSQIESELFGEKYSKAPQSKIKSSAGKSLRHVPQSSQGSSGGRSSPSGISSSNPFPSSSVGSGSSKFNPFSDESSSGGGISASRPPKLPPEFKAKDKRGPIRRGKDQRNEEMRVVTKIKKFEDLI